MPLHVDTMCEGPGPLGVGDQIGRRSHVTDDNGVPTNTSTFDFNVRLPNHTVVPAAITHEGVGVYFATLPVFTLPGIYRWAALATGLINQRQQGSFRVLAAAF